MYSPRVFAALRNSIVSALLIFLCVSNAFKTPKNVLYNNHHQTKLYMKNEIQHSHSIQKQKIANLAKTLAWGATAVASVSYKPHQSLAAGDSSASFLPECSESIIVLRKGNSQAVVIGTAHISDESAKLVQRTIQKVSPDLVMIELDPKRVGKFSKPIKTALSALPSSPSDKTSSSSTPTSPADLFLIPSFGAPSLSTDLLSSSQLTAEQRKPNLFLAVFQQIKSIFDGIFQTVSGLALGTILSQFYKSIEKLGFNTGTEFKVAVQEAKRLGIKVLLGDRDVDVTLQRLSVAISAYPAESFDRLMSRLEKLDTFSAVDSQSLTLDAKDKDFDKEKLSFFVESLKQRKSLQVLASVLKEEVPLVYQALIGERDVYMANAIAEANSGISKKDSSSDGGSKFQSIVGVVGMMHLDGIERTLINTHGYKLLTTSSCQKDQLEVEIDAKAILQSQGVDIPIIS